MKRNKIFIAGAVVLIIASPLLLFRTCHKENAPQRDVDTSQQQQPNDDTSQSQQNVSGTHSDTSMSPDVSLTQGDEQMSPSNGTQLSRLTKSSSAKKTMIEYKPEHIVGEWRRGPIHDIFYDDGTGKTWDESDDVSEDEAKTFRWSLKHNILQTDYSLATGGVIPMLVYVTKADSVCLHLRDDFGNIYICNKVNNDLVVMHEKRKASR